MILLLDLIYNAVDAFLFDALHHPLYFLIALTIVIVNFGFELRRSQIAAIAIHDVFGLDLLKRLLPLDLNQIEPKWFCGDNFTVFNSAIFRCLSRKIQEINFSRL